MLQLAIECSGQGGSIALFDNLELIQSSQLPADQGNVETLAPAIKELLGARRPELLSVVNGPGSFTSLRVGLAQTKMLAFAWDIPVVAIETLKLIAMVSVESAAPLENKILLPCLNAFRKQVFVAAYRAKQSGVEQVLKSTVIDAEKWQQDPLSATLGAEADSSFEGNVYCTGPGLKVYPVSGHNASLVDEKLWEPNARFMGKLGLQAFQSGTSVSAEELLPNYVRQSAAEEKLNARD